MNKLIHPFSVLTLFLVVMAAATSAGAVLQVKTKPKSARGGQTSPNARTLQRELSKQKAKVEQLEGQLNQITGIVLPDLKNALETIVKAKAQSDSATIMLINRINSLQNKIQILEDKAAYADSTNFEILTQLVMIENKIVTLTRSFNELYALKTTSSSDLYKISPTDFKHQYVEALGHYQNHEFQQAIDGFSKLVLSGSAHELADNSQYWLGECYYSLKNYKRAILEFEKVFEYADSDKRDDAQLKLGLSYKSMGNKKKAAEEFQKLLDYYPDSEYYQKAQQYLRHL